MKFVLYCSNRVIEPGESKVLGAHPLPDPLVMEEAADVLVPTAYRLELDPFDTIFAEISPQCFAIAALLMNLLQIRRFEPMVHLSAHVGETAPIVKERITQTIRRVARERLGNVIYITSDIAALVTVQCMASNDQKLLKIERAMQVRKNPLSIFSIFECTPSGEVTPVKQS
ncbi:MAG: hypothetical protein Q7R93_01365 [bacterium]|nr:hypothetical protein [bacterium]